MRLHLLPAFVAIVLAVTAIPFNLENADAEQSDADTYGYKYTDAKDPEPKIDVNYYNIKGDPNKQGLDTRDSSYALLRVDMGFNFLYYGQSFNKIYISTWGAMSFVESSGSNFYYYNFYNTYILPSSGAPKGLMAVYWTWDNCYTANSDRLYTLQTEIDNEKVFIVEWNTQSGNQFQAILYESGMIKYQYQTVTSRYPSGSYCFIGIESPDSSTGVAYVSRHQNSPNNKFDEPFAIAFTNQDVLISGLELTNGHGRNNDKIYAGSEPYVFRTEIYHSRSRDDIIGSTLVLGSEWGQEKIRFAYFHENSTFTQISGEEYARLATMGSTVQSKNQNTIVLSFSIEFNLGYPSEDRRNATISATGRSAAPAKYEAGEIYYVESDIEWDPERLIVKKTTGDEGYIRNNDYVAGAETVLFTGFRIFYENSDVQPSPMIVSVNITDNYGIKKVGYIPKGGSLSVTWTAVDETTSMTFDFEVVGIPFRNRLSDDFQFTFKVDDTPPGRMNPEYFEVFPDELGGSKEPYDPEENIYYDNDDNIYLKWRTITDGESGIGAYMLEAKKEGRTIQRSIPVTDPDAFEMSTHLGETSSEMLENGRYNLSIRAVDIVGNVGPTIYTTIIVDTTGPRFTLISPSEGEWTESQRPMVLVLVEDDLSPIDGQTLFYRVSTNDGITFSEWESMLYYGNSRKEVEIEITPRLAEGKINWLEFRGQDLAGSGLTYSDEIPIWSDFRAPNILMNEPSVDENGTTVNWLRSAADEKLRITIHDWRGSGIDPTRMSYRYSLDGEDFSADIPIEGEPFNNSQGFEEYSFLIDKNWQEGDNNLLVVDAYDNVGRNTTAVFRIRLDVTPEVEVITPVPGFDYFDNMSIDFKARIIDLDGDEDVTVTWMSNLDGPFGFEKEFSAFLEPGQHIITLTVDDGVHSIKRSLSIVVISALTEDPAYKDTDGDGMNDSYEITMGLDPERNDAGEDLDNDGYTNLEEYYAGTDPTRSKEYPGSSIKDYEIPIAPIVLIILGIMGLIIFGVVLVRESNKIPSNVAPPLPGYYGQQLPPPAARAPQPALPPAGGYQKGP